MIQSWWHTRTRFIFNFCTVKTVFSVGCSFQSLLLPHFGQNDKLQGSREDRAHENWTSADSYVLNPSKLPQKIPSLIPQLPATSHSSILLALVQGLPRFFTLPAHLERTGFYLCNLVATNILLKNTKSLTLRSGKMVAEWEVPRLHLSYEHN